MIKFSERLKIKIEKAAVCLSAEHPQVWLEGIYNGLCVSIDKSDKFPSDELHYRDFNIEKEGVFYLICRSIMGGNVPKDDLF